MKGLPALMLANRFADICSSVALHRQALGAVVLAQGGAALGFRAGDAGGEFGLQGD
jgi:hypothetical protein